MEAELIILIMKDKRKKSRFDSVVFKSGWLIILYYKLFIMDKPANKIL